MNSLSFCFFTNKVKECTSFYQEYFSGKITFDCGWYINISLLDTDFSIQFMQPQGDQKLFSKTGIMINMNVNDVDAQYTRLESVGATIAMPLEDHPWGDRGFSVIDPIGNSVYVYSDREPSEEFAQYYKGEL